MSIVSIEPANADSTILGAIPAFSMSLRRPPPTFCEGSVSLFMGNRCAGGIQTCVCSTSLPTNPWKPWKTMKSKAVLEFADVKAIAAAAEA
ncbi:MAG: hypothetical protein ACREXG_15305, partial [Polaromonas sp.]